MIDLATAMLEMHASICNSTDPETAWKQVVAIGERAGGEIPPDIRGASGQAETIKVVHQVQDIFRRSPPPVALTFLYFGLFTGVTESGEEIPGFYLSGGTSADREPTIESRADLPYFPDDRFLDSPLLRRIKAEALRGGEDYNFFDYALMFSGAAIMAKFALRALQIDKTLVVGFDSGDRLVIT